MRHRSLGVLLAALVVIAVAGTWYFLAKLGSESAQAPLVSAQGAGTRVQAAPPPTPQSGWETVHLDEVVPETDSQDIQAEIQQLWEPMVEEAKTNKWKAWGYVIDADSGTILLDRDGTVPHTPASTMKVFVGLTALDLLDPLATLSTGTALEGTAVYLWGEGDLLLTAGPSTGTTSGQAGLADLADATARALQEDGIADIKLVYQDKLFEGRKRPSIWAKEEVSEFAGDVGPYAIDTGRTSPGEWDFVADSAKAVAASFAEELADLGITVRAVSAGPTPEGAVELARVESAPQHDQIALMLRDSDNTLAEQYCHLTASAAGAPTTFTGSTQNLITQLDRLGVNTEGMIASDCSGLASTSKVTGVTLTDALEASLQPGVGAHELIRMLPRGGLEGTLADRHTEGAGLGNLQAKTGSLGSVATLTGVVTTQTGQNLLLAVGADKAPEWMGYYARFPIDDFVEGLAELH